MSTKLRTLATLWQRYLTELEIFLHSFETGPLRSAYFVMILFEPPLFVAGKKRKKKLTHQLGAWRSHVEKPTDFASFPWFSRVRVRSINFIVTIYL